MSHLVIASVVESAGCRKYTLPSHINTAQIEQVRQAVKNLPNVISASGSTSNWIEVSARDNGPAVLDPQVQAAIRQALGSNDYTVVAG